MNSRHYLLLISLMQAIVLVGQPVDQVEIINGNLSLTLKANGQFSSIKYRSPNAANNWVEIADSSGFWFTGLDPGGSPHAMILDGADNRAGFSEAGEIPGIWRVTAEEIHAFQQDYQDNQQIDDDHPSIFAWPGAANPLFSTYNDGLELPDVPPLQLAGFYNMDDDPFSYNPAQGDFPWFNYRRNIDGISYEPAIPKEMYWLSFNHYLGQSAYPRQIGVSLLIVHYECQTTGPDFGSSIFFNVSVHNQGPEYIIYCHLGLKLSSQSDSYIGSLPVRDIAYMYKPLTTSDCGPSTLNSTVLGIRSRRGPEAFLEATCA